MPEGPTLVIAKEKLHSFIGKKIISAGGYAKVDMDQLYGQKITDIKTWGKHLLICFTDFTVQIHFLMFGSFLVDETKRINPKLHLHFADTDLYFYMTSVHIIYEPLTRVYDFSADIMNNAWDAKKAVQKMKDQPSAMVCDSLLDQRIFSGSGNIIKNEVLFRLKLHPQNTISNLPAAKLTALAKETRKYAFDFLKWKLKNEFSKHWQAYEQKECPRCEIPLHKKLLGKTKRQTYFCDNCQVKY
ncbi:MAG: DNA-formamidopyrimidine glycosylase family protein [Chitinophagaceae bacterium]